MTNDITCQICLDLIPLVRDGVASDDSCEAVRAHIAVCPECAAAYEEPMSPPTDQALLNRLIRKTQIFCAMLMAFGMFFGLTLTAGNGVFYNVLIMPLVGALGYMIFRRKACWLVPLLLTLTHFVTNLLPGKEYLEPLHLLLWSVIYSVAALIGTIIAWLFHFALRKE